MHDMAGDPSLPRTVKAGLGGHEAGVLGDDDGVKNASLPLRKRGRTTLLVCATFSGFAGVENQNDGENENGQNKTSPQGLFLMRSGCVCNSHCQALTTQSMNGMNNSLHFFCSSAQKIRKRRGIAECISLSTTSLLAVLILTVILILNILKTTEGRTNNQGHLSPFP